jgi:Arc/MetJ-type ribon-helix-helix transcriptional regulator
VEYIIMEDSDVVRTIIQLSEAQSKALKERAREQGVSASELVRQGVDMVLGSRIGDAEARKRAIAAVGYASSGNTDVSERHDDYLAEAYKQ